MKNILSLTRILLKGTGVMRAGSRRKGKRKQNPVLTAIGMTVLFLYFAMLSGGMGAGLGAAFHLMDMDDLFPHVVMGMGGMAILILSFIYVVTIFYHSGDVETLLALPLRPREIIAAKFAMVTVYCLIVACFIILPVLIGGGYSVGRPAGYYIYSVLVYLFSPLIPLSMVSIVIMLLMRFTTFARNKDRFITVSTIIVMVLILAMTMLPTGIMETAEGGDIALPAGQLTAAAQADRLFPGYFFAGKTLAASGPHTAIWFSGYLLASAAWLAAALFTADRVYLPGAMAARGAGGTKRARLSGTELARGLSARSFRAALVSVEIRTLIRTPVYFLNNVIGGLIVPIIMLLSFVPVYMQEAGRGMSWREALADMRGQAAILSDPSNPVVFIVIAGVIALSGFLSMGNALAATALSREGKQAYLMKIWPVHYKVQFRARLLWSVLFSLFGILPLLILAVVLILPPAWLVLLSLLLVCLIVLGGNFVGLLFDLRNPMLEWTDENEVVKNNLNSLWQYLISLAVSGILLALLLVLRLVLWPGIPLLLYSLLAAGLSALFAFIPYTMVRRRINPVMTALDL